MKKSKLVGYVAVCKNPSFTAQLRAVLVLQ